MLLTVIFVEYASRLAVNKSSLSVSAVFIVKPACSVVGSAYIAADIDHSAVSVSKCAFTVRSTSAELTAQCTAVCKEKGALTMITVVFPLASVKYCSVLIICNSIAAALAGSIAAAVQHVSVFIEKSTDAKEFTVFVFPDKEAAVRCSGKSCALTQSVFSSACIYKLSVGRKAGADADAFVITPFADINTAV